MRRILLTSMLFVLSAVALAQKSQMPEATPATEVASLSSNGPIL